MTGATQMHILVYVYIEVFHEKEKGGIKKGK